ncbi:DUF6151 family protein [Paracoccus sp. TK19116]|uniref:DUF6151 family protein n=1 Tax=Paracoccus albicereus TaxID=2922394 RepID=A0ABT1MN40_9RHOB|nr:DUF6151 family protein [Paracoccus albicereus]MCQ0969680.1 DUF6151 family protein [Paracoccus albicereus]
MASPPSSCGADGARAISAKRFPRYRRVMRISCDCGTFQAELTRFPDHTPGRLVCYCRDCQSFLNRLGRHDLLDDHGGTEVIPVYPSEIWIVSGVDQLQCNRLSPNGIYRWSVRCCNSPIGNMRAGIPWFGILHNAFHAADPNAPKRLGPVRARIYGRDAIGQPPFPISHKIGFRDMLAVLPFILKGRLAGKTKGSPFTQDDGITPIVEPRLL